MSCYEAKEAMQKAMYQSGASNALISECGSIFDDQLGQGVFPPSCTLLLFNNLEINNDNLEVAQ